MKQARVGFSLIELLVVISIVALLTAIAVPAYKHYQAKAKVQKVYMILANFAQSLYVPYQRTGSYPSQVTFYDGTTFSASTWQQGFASPGSFNGMYGFSYGTSQTFGGSDGRGFVLGTPIGGLTGIPNYTDPSIGGWNAGNTIYVGVREVNNTMRIVCGTWAANQAYTTFPPDYLPQCTCTTVLNFVLTGTGC